MPGVAQDSGRGRKFKAPPPTARLDVTVLRDVNGKPIENAAVIFHPIHNDKDTGAMELKTNSDGKTMIDILPLGDTVRLQVIAKGFQTYGADYKVDKPSMAIEVKLKRPGAQYSIYPPRDASATTTGKPAGDASQSSPPAASSQQPPE